MPMRSNPQLRTYFDEYGQFHRNRANIVCHLIGIPLVMLSLLGLAGRAGFSYFDAGQLIVVGSLCWYFFLDWRIAVPFGMLAIGIYFIGTAIAAKWLIVMFAAGWVFQLVGHYVFEKKAPAFSKNLLHLLIGPFWIFAKVTGYERSREVLGGGQAA